MSARDHTPHADPNTEGPEPWERALLDARLEMLGRLAEMGMELAAAIKDQATPERLAEPGAAATVAMAFGRVSRAVRMTLALQSRLIEDFKAAPKAGSAKAASGKADSGDAEDKCMELRWLEPETVRRRRVEDIVRGLAEDSELDAETVERVAVEAGERLEEDDIYGSVMVRAVGELVADICLDLGLGADAIASPLSLDRVLGMDWNFDAEATRKADPYIDQLRRAQRRAGRRPGAPDIDGPYVEEPDIEGPDIDGSP